MSNIGERKQPLGDRSLNNCVLKKSDYDHLSGCSLKLPVGSSSMMRHHHNVQSSNSVTNSINYTPNHRTSSGRGNASFKSPISLCFDRMLGAGKFVDKFLVGDILAFK